MNPVTHLLVSWTVASIPRKASRRDRVLISLGGIIPDLDGLGYVPDQLTRLFAEEPTRYFHRFHHELGHNLGFAIVVFVAALLLATREHRLKTAALVALTFHLHLLCDILGARGPDGSQWPIPYLLPFSEAWQLKWSGQWELNAWPNFVITFGLLGYSGWSAVRHGRSVVEVFSLRADAAIVRTLRQRFSPGRLAEDPSTEQTGEKTDDEPHD